MNEFTILQILHNVIMVVHLAAWTVFALALWKLRFALKSRWADAALISSLLTLVFMLPFCTFSCLANFLPMSFVNQVFEIPYLIQTVSMFATLAILAAMISLAGLIATRFAGTLAKPAKISP
jgi:hypothetical protein